MAVGEQARLRERHPVEFLAEQDRHQVVSRTRSLGRELLAQEPVHLGEDGRGTPEPRARASTGSKQLTGIGPALDVGGVFPRHAEQASGDTDWQGCGDLVDHVREGAR